MGFNSFTFASQVCSVFSVTINSLAEGNTKLNNWTNDTADLNKAWTLGPSDLSATIAALPNDPNNKNAAATTNFLNQYVTGTNPNIYSFCQKDMSALLDLIANNEDFSSGGSGTTQMSEVQQTEQLLGGTITIETSTGDTETKAQASFQQQTTSSPQVAADIGNNAIGLLSTAASMLMQSFL